MNRDLTNYRKSYDKSNLTKENVPLSPFQLFTDWFTAVEEEGGIEETNAMTLTTVADDGMPKARIVLLKHYDNNGFVFYTNYNSEKGKAIATNNKVCISFFWPNLERQVIIKGIANKISEAESTTYFQSRPKGSQLGAWASHQSTVISSRDILENALASLEKKHETSSVLPKPPFWGGYRIEPLEFEFWQGRPNRLHDRIRYEKNIELINDWKLDRLSP